MRIYLRILALFYLFGALAHLSEIASLGETPFSQQPTAWQVAHVNFAVLDLAAVIGLWLGQWWGVASFLLAATSQLVMYLGLTGTFGEQPALVVFHVVTIGIYLALFLWRRRRRKTPTRKSSSGPRHSCRGNLGPT